jgi:hypothetical protein
MWTAFLNMYYNPDSPISEIGQFRLYIIKEMEMRFATLPSVSHFETDFENDRKHVKIAMINFAFNNSKMIYMLKRRGDLIKAESWKKLRK